MITILQRFTYHYFPIYCLTVYSFLIHLHYKTEFPSANNKIEISTPLRPYSLLEASSKEGKILLDLTYKNIMSSYSLGTRSYRYVIDFEGKVLGHRVEHDEKSFSNLTSVTMNLNKKLLHSTIFGSIKLIKV
jgi:hypothetical protein